MNRSYRAVTAALTALVLVPSVVPSAAAAQSRVAVHASVPVADLDLSREADHRRFADRLRRAARQVCGTGASLAERMDSARCRREMTADATVQLAARPTRVRVAQVDPAALTPQR